jgi:quercetin dioxygenase-like cupin family protein
MVDDSGGDPACWSHLFDDDALNASGVVDLDAVQQRAASGVVWSAPPADLNANVVVLPADTYIDEHVQDEVDVLFVILSGEGEITVDDVAHAVTGQQLLLIPRNARRSVRASRWGLVYLTVHRARGPMQIKPSRPN